MNIDDAPTLWNIVRVREYLLDLVAKVYPFDLLYACMHVHLNIEYCIVRGWNPFEYFWLEKSN